MTFGIDEMAKYLFKHHNKKSQKRPYYEYREIPKTLCDGMTEVLTHGGKVRLERIGVIEVKISKGRTCRNPRTGETFVVGDRKALRFKPSKHISAALNGPVKKRRPKKKVTPT